MDSPSQQGESDFSSDNLSSEDEASEPKWRKNRQKAAKKLCDNVQRVVPGDAPSSVDSNKLAEERQGKESMESPDGMCSVDLDLPAIKTQPEDSFYAALDGTAEYDNAVNQHATTGGATGAENDRTGLQEEAYRAELAKLEQEIATLRTVLSSKVNQANQLKQKLGITPMKEFQNDVRQGIRNIKESDTYQKASGQLSNINQKITSSPAYQKTSEKVSDLSESISKSEAYQKTNAAFKSFGDWSSKKIGNMRNSTAFRSVEEKVGGAYSSVKSKLSSSKSEDNFGQPLDEHSVSNDIPEETSASSPGSTEKVPL